MKLEKYELATDGDQEEFPKDDGFDIQLKLIQSGQFYEGLAIILEMMLDEVLEQNQ